MKRCRKRHRRPVIELKVIDYIVLPTQREQIEAFVETWHYSGSINGVVSDYCFKLMTKDRLHIIGAAIFGRMAMANQWRPFGESEEEVIELRRLCCIDDTPHNTESYFISRCMRWLENNTKHKVVVSYADAEYGHIGTIYRASNFSYHGFKSGAKVIKWNGKTYHDKTIRTKYKGQLKPFAIELKEALDRGDAVYAETAGKHCYVRKLRSKYRERQLSLI